MLRSGLMTRTAWWSVTCALSLVAFAPPALGQDVPPKQRAEPHPPPPTRVFPDLASDFWHLFTSLENALVAAGGGALALAASTNDRDLTMRLQDQASLRSASTPGGVIGNALFQFGIGSAFYAWGRARDDHKVGHIGWDLLRGQIVSQTVTQVVKTAVKKERPDGSNSRSFPSGHASGVFTSASILHQHFGWKVGAPSYVISSYVALSRLPSNRHFLSDIIFGSAVGIAAGRSVTFHERNLPPKIQLEPFLTPHGTGVVFRFHRSQEPGSPPAASATSSMSPTRGWGVLVRPDRSALLCYTR